MASVYYIYEPISITFMQLRDRFLNPKPWRRSFILVGCLVAIIFSRLIYLAFTSKSVTSRKILPEFHNLFTREAQSKLNIPLNYESRYESLSSNYFYEDKYYLSIRKFTLTNKLPIEKLISEENGKPFFTGGIFSEDDNDFLEMGFKTEKIDTIKRINIYLKGDSIATIVKNDTMVCYYLNAKSFYLYFNDTSSPNIKGEAKHDSTPFSIMFIKKNESVYFLMMGIKQAGETMKPDLLYSLINK
jgi:hypothetical protein